LWGLVVILAATTARAAEWDIRPRIGVQETYSSNITLAPPGEEESDFVTQINPGIAVEADGRRLDFRLNYRLQSLFYAEHSKENRTYQQLSTDLNAEIVRDTFFIDTGAEVGQQAVTTLGAFSFDNVAITDNRTTVGRWFVTPNFSHQFGNAAIGQLSYTYSEVKYDEQDVAVNLSDSTSQRVFMSLSDVPDTTDVGWSVFYDYDEVDYQVVGDQTFEQGRAELRYPEAAAAKLIAQGIYENYSVPGPDPAEGTGWLLGIGWTPSARTNLEILGGERFFGDAYYLNFSHRTRRTNWTARCNQEVTTTQRIVSGDLTLPLLTPGGDPVLDDQGNPLFVEVPATTLVPETFLIKGCGAGVSVTTAKSEAYVSLTVTRRDYRDDRADEQVGTLGAGWDWTFAPRTTFGLRAQFFRQGPVDSSDQTDTWRLTAGAQREFARDSRFFGGVSYLDRPSSAVGQGYTASYVGVGAIFVF
jgi:hypothetical protein